ncbi:MAG: Altered inheritance of mitochondria protein 32 [Pleopsidium flavum]|nr:MAG: Altered inheritance of mitochondria protein 32 [Pleopsidium flavum]
MPSYAQQIVISTGKDDWASNIVDDVDAVLARKLKRLFGRRRRLHDPYNNIMITHSSFYPTPIVDHKHGAQSVYLFPSFKYVPMTSDSIVRFIQAFLLPAPRIDVHGVLLSASLKSRDLIQGANSRSLFRGWREVDEVVILICGHGGRDERCGIMGPLLRTEFARVLSQKEFEINEPAISAKPALRNTARVGLISHIGGHKFAGNVIIYIPPTFREKSGPSPLAGKGIWYGRVEPKHVEGIVEETILGGRVIAELFRGGVGQNGEILRL